MSIQARLFCSFRFTIYTIQQQIDLLIKILKIIPKHLLYNQRVPVPKEWENVGKTMEKVTNPNNPVVFFDVSIGNTVCKIQMSVVISTVFNIIYLMLL